MSLSCSRRITNQCQIQATKVKSIYLGKSKCHFRVPGSTQRICPFYIHWILAKELCDLWQCIATGLSFLWVSVHWYNSACNTIKDKFFSIEQPTKILIHWIVIWPSIIIQSGCPFDICEYWERRNSSLEAFTIYMKFQGNSTKTRSVIWDFVASTIGQ